MVSLLFESKDRGDSRSFVVDWRAIGGGKRTLPARLKLVEAGLIRITNRDLLTADVELLDAAFPPAKVSD